MGGTELGLHRLRTEISARGLDARPTGRVVAELAVHVTLSLGGIAVFLAAEHWAACAAAMLVSTAGSLGVGSNSHTSSHGASSPRRWVNRALTYFGSPFFFGVSATFWWDKHVASHHRAPNVVGSDPDIDLAPWFVLSQAELRGLTGWRRWYHERAQWLVFPLAVGASLLNMQKDSWRFLYRRLTGPGFDAAHGIDLAAMCAHVVVFIGVPMFFYPVVEVAGFTLLRWMLYGYAMFLVLAPAHWPREAAFRTGDAAAGAGFVERQLQGTVNFRAGRIGGFFCSGLDFQIEHHLFPTICHVHYPALRPLVRRFCAEHGLSHRTLGWAEAVRGCLSVVRRPKPVDGGPVAE